MSKVENATVHKCPNDKVKNADETFETIIHQEVKCLSCGTIWRVVK